MQMLQCYPSPTEYHGYQTLIYYSKSSYHLRNSSPPSWSSQLLLGLNRILFSFLVLLLLHLLLDNLQQFIPAILVLPGHLPLNQTASSRQGLRIFRRTWTRKLLMLFISWQSLVWLLDSFLDSNVRV